MTPGEIITLARQKWNAVTDTFFSDAELYTLIYAAETELALETRCIRNVYSASTVANQQEYSKPSLCISVKRVTYDGRPLIKITDKEDDYLTNNDQDSATTGTPLYYWEWDDVIELRVIPDSVVTLKMYTFDMPSTVTSTSTLDVPLRYHVSIADYLVAHMATKDKNYQAATAYTQMWNKHVADIKRYERSLVRGDAFAHVLNEESQAQDLRVL